MYYFIDEHEVDADMDIFEPEPKKQKLDVNEEILQKYGNVLWKTTKMKYMVNYMLCAFCIAYNRRNEIKIVDGRAVVSTSMCPTCVKANCDYTTVYYMLNHLSFQ
jgi:hypothetical protein